MSLRTVLILLIGFFSGQTSLCQTLGFSLAPGKSKVQFPIEVYNNLVVVPMVLNGQLPLKFILDTGVRTSILTEKAFSDILNLPYARRYSIAGPGGEKLVEAFITNNVSFDLPGVQGRGHAMLVLEQDYLELRNYLGTDVHGILGYELFSRFIIEVNYEHKTLTLMLPERFREKRKFESIPIQIEDTKPYMMASISMNDTTTLSAKLMVDSGASHGIFLETSSNPKIKVPEKSVSSIIGRGLGGVITGQIARIKSIRLGRFEITNVITNFPDPNSYLDTLKTSRTVFRNGSLGGEVLSRFTVIYNFPGEKIYLKKNSNLKKEFYFNLSGLTIRARGARLKNFEVTNVRPNSTSDRSDIKVGDRIVTVNGIEAMDLDLNAVNAFLNSKPGKRIHLEIERKGVRMKKDFRLAETL